jgi:hypothetical protein
LIRRKADAIRQKVEFMKTTLAWFGGICFVGFGLMVVAPGAAADAVGWLMAVGLVGTAILIPVLAWWRKGQKKV